MRSLSPISTRKQPIDPRNKARKHMLSFADDSLSKFRYAHIFEKRYHFLISKSTQSHASATMFLSSTQPSLRLGSRLSDFNCRYGRKHHIPAKPIYKVDRSTQLSVRSALTFHILAVNPPWQLHPMRCSSKRARPCHLLILQNTIFCRFLTATFLLRPSCPLPKVHLWLAS